MIREVLIREVLIRKVLIREILSDHIRQDRRNVGIVDFDGGYVRTPRIIQKVGVRWIWIKHDRAGQGNAESYDLTRGYNHRGMTVS